MSFAAIPTMYAGVQFRSRLEARWAAFFDLWGMRWDYEPLDLPGWIPDFVVDRCLVEVKPSPCPTELKEHGNKIAASVRAAKWTSPTNCVYLLGSYPGAILASWSHSGVLGSWQSPPLELLPWGFPQRKEHGCACGGPCTMECAWLQEYGLAMVRRWKAAGNAVQYKRPR